MPPLADNFYLLPSNSLVKIEFEQNQISIDNEPLNLEAATSIITSSKSLKFKGFTKKDRKIESFEYHLSHGQPNTIEKWHKNLKTLGCSPVSKLAK